MKEIFCSPVLNSGNISSSCIVNLNNNNKIFVTIDDKGILVYPSLNKDDNNIQLNQCIPPSPLSLSLSSLKVLRIFSIDDIIILSAGPDNNNRYHLLLYKNNDKNNLNLLLSSSLSIVYKPVDIIKYIYQNSLYIVVASIDTTLHVYEVDNIGRLSRSSNRSTIRSLFEKRIGLSSTKGLILRLIKNHNDNTNDDILVAAYSNGYICYDYIKGTIPSISRQSPTNDWFYGESPRDNLHGQDIGNSRNESLDSTYHDNVDTNNDKNIDNYNVKATPEVNQRLLLFEGAISCICFYNMNNNIRDNISKNNNAALDSVYTLNASRHSFQSNSTEAQSPRDNKSETWKSVLGGISIANTNSFSNTLSFHNQLSMESIDGSDNNNNTGNSRYLLVGSTTGNAALLSLDNKNSNNAIPIPAESAESVGKHGGVQAIALGDTLLHGSQEIYVGYSDGTIIRASIVYNDNRNKNDDSNTIRKFEFKETWSFKLPFPILSLTFGKLLNNNSDDDFIYQSNHLIATTTKTIHIFGTDCDGDQIKKIDEIFANLI